MKIKKIIVLVLLISCVCFLSYEKQIDYSLNENWAYFAVGGDEKQADLFLICPTVDIKNEYNMSIYDTKTKNNFLGALNMERGIYEQQTKMYAPYYRQASLKAYELSENMREKYLSKAYKDIALSFEYYLKHENKNRPIILAGFSQGADMCYRLLKDYFDDEKLYERLVAVYAIGWPLSYETAEKFPQIKPAQSSQDFGVVVTFDCEAVGVKGTVINPEGTKSHAINPLNWRDDNTFADKELNLGACFTNYDGEIVNEIKNLCGCFIDDERGVLKVSDIDSKDYPAIIKFLPNGSYHIYDYMFFFRNLQENVNDRINAFMKLNHRE